MFFFKTSDVTVQFKCTQSYTYLLLSAAPKIIVAKCHSRHLDLKYKVITS